VLRVAVFVLALPVFRKSLSGCPLSVRVIVPVGHGVVGNAAPCVVGNGGTHGVPELFVTFTNRM
jgi:hypothetical protein